MTDIVKENTKKEIKIPPLFAKSYTQKTKNKKESTKYKKKQNLRTVPESPPEVKPNGPFFFGLLMTETIRKTKTKTKTKAKPVNKEEESYSQREWLCNKKSDNAHDVKIWMWNAYGTLESEAA